MAGLKSIVQTEYIEAQTRCQISLDRNKVDIS